MEPQPLPSIPAYGHKFYALAFHPHPTFAARLVSSAFKIQSEVCGGAFCVETVEVFKSLALFAEELGCCLVTLS